MLVLKVRVRYITSNVKLFFHVCYYWVAESCHFFGPWTVALQAPLSVRFSRQEYWSGFPFPSPGDLPDSGTEPVSPALAGRFFTTKPPGKPFPWLYLSKDNFFLTSILTHTEKYFVASLNLSGALEGFGAVLRLTASRGLLETFSVLTQH